MLTEDEVRRQLYIMEHKGMNDWPKYGINIKGGVCGYCEALKYVLEIDEDEEM